LTTAQLLIAAASARLVHDYPDRFDEDCIDTRGAALADLLIAEWPGPDPANWA
jgi:hypothetical protein